MWRSAKLFTQRLMRSIWLFTFALFGASSLWNGPCMELIWIAFESKNSLRHFYQPWSLGKDKTLQELQNCPNQSLTSTIRLIKMLPEGEKTGYLYEAKGIHWRTWRGDRISLLPEWGKMRFDRTANYCELWLKWSVKNCGGENIFVRFGRLWHQGQVEGELMGFCIKVHSICKCSMFIQPTRESLNSKSELDCK